jgi:hypothetical protein
MRLARLFQELQMPVRAADCLQQVLAIDPGHRDAAQMLAEIKP